MKASILESPGNRPLLIDFELYAAGDDDFRKELITLMIENIRELQKANQQNEHLLFLKACHKVKTTLNILNDNSLSTVIKHISDAARKSENGEPEDIVLLNELCDDIVKSLEQEKNNTN